MTVEQYIEKINTRFKSGISREHSYRADLEFLIRKLVKGVEITNEPANVTDCGNPDYVITKGKIPIGYIEAKDIGKDTFSTMHLIPSPFSSRRREGTAPCRYWSALFSFFWGSWRGCIDEKGNRKWGLWRWIVLHKSAD